MKETKRIFNPRRLLRRGGVPLQGGKRFFRALWNLHKRRHLLCPGVSSQERHDCSWLVSYFLKIPCHKSDNQIMVRIKFFLRFLYLWIFSWIEPIFSLFQTRICCWEERWPTTFATMATLAGAENYFINNFHNFNHKSEPDKYRFLEIDFAIFFALV